MLILANQLTELRASVTVLKSLAILELSPEDPISGAEQLRNLEKTFLRNDPEHQKHEEVSEIMEAVKLWRKHGGGKHEA
jgi:hypothetical protein